jgi:hypothetical protein
LFAVTMHQSPQPQAPAFVETGGQEEEAWLRKDVRTFEVLVVKG